MTASEKIAAAISLLTEAADDKLTERNRLWAASDAAKAAGGDWTDDNRDGNACDAADTTLRGLIEYVAAHTEHI